ncbi:MAG: hypothetical protein M3Y49_17445 [Actinomycetota bacterium]|nr:hypothetical protein [Actinomycetota bacterium]
MSYPLRIRVRHQGYVFSRRDAHEFGVADEQLRAWTASGEAVRATQGVYYIPCESLTDAAFDTETGRRKVRATLLAIGKGHFATHQSALLAWGLPFDASRDAHDVHVGRQGDRHWSRRPGVRLHRVPSGATIAECYGISAICPAFAIVQVGATIGVEAAVIAADSALHNHLISLCDLKEAVRWLSGTPGCAAVAPLSDLVDARSESPGETRLRLILRAAGVQVTPQAVIRNEAGTFVARVDLLVDDSLVIVEFDGLLKYRGEANREALVHEKRREVALQRLGYRVLRFVWADLSDPQQMLSLLRDLT